MPNIFGSNVNHLLNIFGPLTSGVPLTDETGAFYLGEQYALDGRTVEMVGSGFAQPGVSVLGVIVPLGQQVDVMVMRDVDSGQYLFVYPNEPPNLLGAIALVTNTSATPYSATDAGAPPVCFGSGTRIATPQGEREVETIRPGDHVIAANGEALRVLWSGGRLHPQLDPKNRPIVFRPGALGAGLPTRPLRLSPQHRLVVDGSGPTPRLGAARGFIGCPGVHQTRDDAPVGYYHLLLERHALIRAEGVAAESLLLAKQSLAFLGDAATRGIARALGCDVASLAQRPEATPCGQLLTVAETRRDLAARRAVNA